MESRREHPITIAQNPQRVRVVFNGRVVADTTRALTLKEGSLPPVQYVPREDADMTLLERTAHKTHKRGTITGLRSLSGPRSC